MQEISVLKVHRTDIVEFSSMIVMLYNCKEDLEKLFPGVKRQVYPITELSCKIVDTCVEMSLFTSLKTSGLGKRLY